MLGLIPARGGSKRVPGKNLRPLGGKPLICYTIEAGSGSVHLERVIVSTEDPEIAKTAEQWGAEVPFVRPAALAEDSASTIDVVAHALDWLRTEESYDPEAVVLLQPTCPLRTSSDIDGAIELWRSSGADLVVAVERARQHPYWAKYIGSDRVLERVMDIDLNRYHQNQSLPDVVYSNSSIYVARPELVLQHRDFYAGSAVGYVMDQRSSIDIDTEWDLQLCELILRKEC